MDTETISKNGASSISQMSRGNFLRKTCVLSVTLVVAMLIACGGGSGSRSSVVTLEEFKRRYDEIRADNRFSGSDTYERYAASNRSLEEFKRRYDEIRADNRFSGSDTYERYAAN